MFSLHPSCAHKLHKRPSAHENRKPDNVRDIILSILYGLYRVRPPFHAWICCLLDLLLHNSRQHMLCECASRNHHPRCSLSDLKCCHLDLFDWLCWHQHHQVLEVPDCILYWFGNLWAGFWWAGDRVYLCVGCGG